jgi:uncharacterized membrane protein (UPF0127 family)
MQKANDEKIALARKIAVVIAIVVLITLSLALPRTETLSVNSQQYTLQIAQTVAEQNKGLGDRSSLGKYDGMLFVFSTPNIECFWMKNTEFPLDMVWISSNKTVEYIQTNVQPDSYPETYCPTVFAKYVIELNAGAVKNADITIGQQLHF